MSTEQTGQTRNTQVDRDRDEALRWKAVCLECGQEYGPLESEPRVLLWKKVHEALNAGHTVRLQARCGLENGLRAAMLG